jgi:hypothetical protein
MEIEVPIDAPGPFRIIHDGIIVVSQMGRLEVAMRNSDSTSLERACELCIRALTGLPETPVAAAGVNVRFRFTETPDALLDLVNAPVDTVLSDAAYEVRSATTTRVINLRPGLLNIKIEHGSAGGGLDFNFHMDSHAPTELVEWLRRAAEFVEISDRLRTTMGVTDVRPEIHA